MAGVCPQCDELSVDLIGHDDYEGYLYGCSSCGERFDDRELGRQWRERERRDRMSESKGPYISDLTDGTNVVLQAAILRRDQRLTSTGKPYLVFVLRDRTGEVEGRVWDNIDQIPSECIAGTVAKIQANISTYSGKQQLNISRMRVCAEGEFSYADFVPHTKQDPERMFEQVRGYVLMVRDEPLREMLTRVLMDNRAPLLIWPAAQRMHHAWIGGLLEHMLSMCGAASLLCSHYPVNQDLVVAGIVLHDIGKLQELSAGLSFEYTTDGALIGHISMGLLLVERYASQHGISAETTRHLQHLVLSHHGTKENGSPVLPATPEAFVLHAIDLLDSQLAQVYTEIEKVPAGSEFTEWNSGLQRRIYAVRPVTQSTFDPPDNQAQHEQLLAEEAMRHAS